VAVISSEASFIGMDYVPAYSSSKAALQALVRHAARVCGQYKVRVNGVCPGLVINDRKPMTARKEIIGAEPENPLNRHGRPDDVARVLCFLLSEESGWMTGQTISANGGKFMRD
jgi:3-oxoacyl-[acyl-carrier protein] reductase